MKRYVDILLEKDKELLTALIDIEEFYLDSYDIQDYLIDEKNICPKCFAQLKDIIGREDIMEGIYQEFVLGYECTNCDFTYMYT